jgi:hypothetical protein
MKWTNRIENTVLALVTVVMTVFLMNIFVIKPLREDIKAQNEVIVELAKIAKYNYQIQNDFGKMKPRDSQIIIDLENKMNNLAKMDTIQPTPKKKGFWQRLFK